MVINAEALLDTAAAKIYIQPVADYGRRGIKVIGGQRN